jgi:hypothetical protein
MKTLINGFHAGRALAFCFAASLTLVLAPAGAVGVGKGADPEWSWPVDDTKSQGKLMFDRLE